MESNEALIQFLHSPGPTVCSALLPAGMKTFCIKGQADGKCLDFVNHKTKFLTLLITFLTRLVVFPF